MNPMTPTYRFYLEVTFPDQTRKDVAYEVAQEVAIPFRPYDLCDDYLTAAMVGGLMPQQAAICDKERKRLAERISSDMALHIMDAIKSKDTVNGYEQNPTGERTAHKTEE